jgi:Xaa-Pro aminopeptidase
VADAILLFGESHFHPSVLWLTGFLAPDPVVYIENDGKGTLLVSALELTRAQKEARVDRVRSFEDFDFTAIQRSSDGGDEAFARLIAAALEAEGIQRVRVEPDFPLVLARALERLDVAVIADKPLFGEARRRKQPHEIEAIGAAQSAAQQAVARVQQILRDAEIRDGMLYRDGKPLTSSTLISAIETELLQLGYAIDGTIATGGPGSADPHATDTGHLAANQPVILDIFPQGKKSRYFGDLTRTFVVGEPSETWLKMYEAVLAAYQKALETVRAGINAREIHLAVCKTLYDAGFGTLVEGFRRDDAPAMIHGTGHGVGLEIHEAPRVSDIDIQLVEGDVVTIEPGLYHPDHGGVRIEDTVVVTADGHRNLTDYPVGWKP